MDMYIYEQNTITLKLSADFQVSINFFQSIKY